MDEVTEMTRGLRDLDDYRRIPTFAVAPTRRMLNAMGSRFITMLAAAGAAAVGARAADLELIEDNQPARALIPSVANGGSGLGEAWTAVGFDDALWPAGNTGVGYDTDPGTGGDYRSLARFDVAAMRGVNAERADPNSILGGTGGARLTAAVDAADALRRRVCGLVERDARRVGIGAG